MKEWTPLFGIVCGLIFQAYLPAQSAEMTVGDLQEICVAYDAESKATCRFYILGITQGIELGIGIADGKTKGGRPCIPDDVPGSTLEFVVKKFIGEDLMFYPKDREEDAAGFVGGAIVKAFPCRRPKS